MLSIYFVAGFLFTIIVWLGGFLVGRVYQETKQRPIPQDSTKQHKCKYCGA